jgi:hypothetical protein
MKLNGLGYICFTSPDGSSNMTVSILAFMAIVAKHKAKLLEHLVMTTEPWMVQEMAELDLVSGTSPSSEQEEEIRAGEFESIVLGNW